MLATMLAISVYYIIPIWNWSKCKSRLSSSIHLLHYSYMELELRISIHYCYINGITLFLYGIGANDKLLLLLIPYSLHYSYMELELNFTKLVVMLANNYIIPIWNWSYYYTFSISTHIIYYIIPIWNWSPVECLFSNC